MIKKSRAIGINHVALEVGNIDAALEFYGSFLEFEVRSRSETSAFIGLGDQFINFSSGRTQPTDQDRHIGLVVESKETVRAALEALNIELVSSRFLDFLDPWGNRIEIIGYENIQFSKAPNVLRGMGLTHLEKNEKAREELANKGMAID
ncbi:MAG: VOC family protein [Gammaproteobacteria bacterium]|nr:VOC family protein [Gammaproteobacteria bacterium]